MNTEEDEFRRIEREAKRRAAHELADTQVYTSGDQEWMCDQVSAELRGLRDQVQQLKSDLSEKVLNWTDLEAFANLVAAAEREACAELCDDLDDALVDGLADWQFGEAIRARGEQT